MLCSVQDAFVHRLAHWENKKSADGTHYGSTGDESKESDGNGCCKVLMVGQHRLGLRDNYLKFQKDPLSFSSDELPGMSRR